jgi:hypothetical protein
MRPCCRAEHEKTRLEYQHPMECGHAKGALLTCTETEPSGCLWCIDKREWSERLVEAECERDENMCIIKIQRKRIVELERKCQSLSR